MAVPEYLLQIGVTREPERLAQEFSPEEPIFRLKFESDGTPCFYKDGVKNVQEEIDEAAKGSTLQDLILRYERGEVNALYAKEGFFGDFSNAPCTYGEALNFVQNVKDKFYSLPLELREKFDNNIGIFADAISNLSEEDFAKKYFSKGVAEDVVKEEVVKDE